MPVIWTGDWKSTAGPTKNLIAGSIFIIPWTSEWINELKKEKMMEKLLFETMMPFRWLNEMQVSH